MAANVENPKLQSFTIAAVAATTAHSDVTLALANKESAEHMHGMAELYQEMLTRPLIVKAWATNDPNMNPSFTSNNHHHNDFNDNTTIKTVHFVRHGQAFHNLMADQYTAMGKTWTQFSPHDPNNPYTLPELLDAPLTEKGRQQAYLLQSKVNQLPQKPQLVVSSPNCRALQTAVRVFEALLVQNSNSNNHNPTCFVAHEMVREETGVHVCDKRRPVSQQAAEFPQFDFSQLLLLDHTAHGEDPLWSHTNRETKQQVGNRIYLFLQWLAERPERNVAVVSHSGWLLTLFNGILQCQSSSCKDSHDNDGNSSNNIDHDENPLKQWFQTGEMRSVVLQFVKRQS